MNLNWKPILKNILDDPEGFIADGGWDFLDAEGGSASDGDEGGRLEKAALSCVHDDPGSRDGRQACLQRPQLVAGTQSAGLGRSVWDGPLWASG